MFEPHPAVPHPRDYQPETARVNAWLATHLAVVFGSVWTVWVFFLFPLAAKYLGPAVQGQTSYYAQSWIQLFALPLFVYVGNKLQKSSDAQSEVMHQALTHIANVSDQSKVLIEQNTELTRQIHDLTTQVSDVLMADGPDSLPG